jgi:membrane peptidoglycan carboxypeptidase
VNFPACPNGVNTTVPWQEPGGTPYAPSNDDSANGPVDMIYGFAQSVNTYFLRLEEKTGLCQPATIAASMGVTQDNDSGSGKPLQQIPSFTLGTNNITPVAMAEAYATLASGGTYCKPYVITGVTDASGKQYPAQTKQCAQVLDTNTVNELTYLLQGVVKWGTAAGAVPLDGRQVAGKTGTTDSGVATWFDGYTPQLATAVWTGFINWNTTTSMSNITIGPTYYSGQVAGATISAPIFNQAMTSALQGVTAGTFTAPTGFDNSGDSQNQGNPTPPPGGATTGGATAGATTGGVTGAAGGAGNGIGGGNGNTTGNGGFFGGIF